MKPDRTSRRPTRRLLGCGLFLIGCLWGTLLPAQEVAAGGEPPARFLIETISVENAEKFSPQIIVSESLLEEGSSYTEADLRDAIHRIIRLPLILDAEFALRKGSSRGHYKLLIRVDEARRWFFGQELALTYWARGISFQNLFTDDFSVATSTLAGRRFSVGRYGVFFAAAGGDDGTLQLGYSQYNLLGRNVLLNLSLSTSGCASVENQEDERSDVCRTELFDLGLDPTFSTWSATGDSQRLRLDLSVPLDAKESIRLQGFVRETDSGFRRPAYNPDPGRFFDFRDRDELKLNLSWVYNSLDDPVFPTDGTTVEAGLDFHRLAADLFNVDLERRGPTRLFEMESVELGLSATAARYRPLSRRQTLFAKANLYLGRSDIDNLPLAALTAFSGDLDVWRAGVSLGQAVFLKRDHQRPRWRDWRWENEAELFVSGTSPDLGQPENPFQGLRLSSGITFRNTWGVFSLRLSYVDTSGD